MMRNIAMAILIATATPALAQHMDHGAHAPAATSSPPPGNMEASCPPEHAAMGHCIPKPAPQTPQTDPKCPPEHAAMGHCKPSVQNPAPKAAEPPATDPKCPPEHAAMGHCVPAPGPTAPPPPPSDPGCPPEHAAMGHCKPTGWPASKGPSAAASSGPAYAADTVWGTDAMAQVRRAVFAEHGSMRTGKLLLDRLEYRAKKGHDGYAWEGEGWYGGDYDRLWIKSHGEGGLGDALESAEVQALWSRALDPWFNLQAGVRYDIRPKPDRAHLVLGLQGLAPYFFEVDTALFLSDRGDLSARIEAEYDQRITNQLILQPRAEVSLAAQDVPSIGIGAGLSSIEAGLRLRYEIIPEFAPYVGVEYERSLGDTADFARLAGESVGGWAFVAGVRAWF